jgi:hypothetical protein
MSGVTEIEELIDGALSILAVAQKTGTTGWSLIGDTLTISDPTLSATVHQVLAKVNMVELDAEVKGLGPFQTMGLATHTLGSLRKILGGT